MDWPSERVTQGGFLQTHKVNYSKDTQDLMKVLMEESRLTMLQRKKINYHLRNGDPLPIWQQNSYKKPQKQNCEQNYRAKSCRRRTLDSIMESDAFSVEKYIPKNAYKEPSEKAKLRLQFQMSGLNEDPDLGKLKIKHKYKHRHGKNEHEDGEFDPAEELLQEIKERIEWLDEMEKLGEAKKHRLVIQSQIQDRLADLKRLQQQKTRNKE
uniref:CSON003133 protein n=1 Tax=Culicoides sonorensis TaxID=179676 RepID=A0A336MKP6_CULSO